MNHIVRKLATAAFLFTLCIVQMGGCSGGGRSSDSEGSPGVITLTDVGLQIIPMTGKNPNGLDIDSETGLVYVLINGSKKLSIVDPVAAEEIASVNTDGGPIWPKVDVQRDLVWVAASTQPGTVVMHQRGTGKRIGQIVVGGAPHDLGLDPNTGLMIVSNTYDDSQTYMSVVDADTLEIVAHHQIDSLPHKIALDEENSIGYVACLEEGIIRVVDMTTGKVTGSFDSGEITETSGMIFSPSTRRLFVGKTSGSLDVAVVAINVDTQEVEGSIPTLTSPIPTRPFHFAIDEERRLLYFTIWDNNKIGVADIDTLEPLAVFEVDDFPYAVVLDLDRGFGYATGTTNNTLCVFSLTKVANSLGR